MTTTRPTRKAPEKTAAEAAEKLGADTRKGVEEGAARMHRVVDVHAARRAARHHGARGEIDVEVREQRADPIIVG